MTLIIIITIEIIKIRIVFKVIIIILILGGNWYYFYFGILCIK